MRNITLYIFPIERESIDIARKYSEQIMHEIMRSYPALCKYLEPADIINISSEKRGLQLIEFKPELPAAFQASNWAKASQNVKGLVSVVTSCLVKYKIKCEPPLKFPI